MTEHRLLDYLDHVAEAAQRACDYTDGMSRQTFLFDINLDVVWETVQSALPELLQHLPAIRTAAQAQLRHVPGA